MCCICNVVNCVRRKLFCCENRVDSRNRYSEPRTNHICANRENSCFEPCCAEEKKYYNCHHHCRCDD